MPPKRPIETLNPSPSRTQRRTSIWSFHLPMKKFSSSGSGMDRTNSCNGGTRSVAIGQGYAATPNSHQPGHLEREHEGEGSGNKERVCRELDPYQGARYVKAANGKERRSQHDKLEPDEGQHCVNVVEKFRNPRNPINNDADA